MVKALPRDWRARLNKVNEEMPMIQRLLKVIGINTHTGPQGAQAEKPHPYWWDTPDNELPRELVQWAREAPDSLLIIASAVEDLRARGKNLSVKTVADYLHISPATFYRRGYNKLLETCLRVLAQDAAVLEKDSRAKRLYKDQVLQETKSEP